MKKLIVTEESVWAAKRAYATAMDKRFTPAGAFDKALDALFVPEGEAQQKPRPLGPGTRLRNAYGDELLLVSEGRGLSLINLTENAVEDSWCEEWLTDHDLRQYLLERLVLETEVN